MKRWFGFFFIVALIGLAILLLRKIDFYEIYLILTYAKWYYVILAFFCTFLTFAIWAFRWSYFFGGVFKKDFWFLFSVLFAGAFFNTITPGAGIGGEPFRAHFLAKRYKKSKIHMLGYILGDKFFQLITLAFLGIISIFFVLIYFKISDNLKLVLEIILLVVLSLATFSIYFTLKKVNFNIGVFFRKLHLLRFVKNNFSTPDDLERYINKTIKMFLGMFRKIVHSKRNLFVGFFLSLVFWTLNFLNSYFLFLAFNHHINFLSVAVVVTLATIIGDLSFVPSGIGVTEITMTLLYSAMGISIPLALLVALLSRIIYYFFSLVVGGICLIYVTKATNGKK